MKTKTVSLLILMMLLLSSCNMPSDAPPPTETPIPIEPTSENTATPPEPTVTPTPSETPLPTDTPLPTATVTPSVPIAFPKDLNVNCRLGYGTEWLAIGALIKEQPATIIGTNPTKSWWYVQLADATQCWVASSVTDTAGSLIGLPIIDQATASIINVTIEEPETITVAGCLGPIQPLNLKGTIETDGPTNVTWHFESEQSGVISDHAIDYSLAGSQTVADSFVPPLVEGSYWVKLVAFIPNEKVAETTYKIECP